MKCENVGGKARRPRKSGSRSRVVKKKHPMAAVECLDAFKVAMRYIADNQQDFPSREAFNALLGVLRQRDTGAVIKHLEVAALQCDPYVPDRFQWIILRQVKAFFSKNAEFTSDDYEEVALQTFKDAEEQCYTTNRRVRAWLSGDLKVTEDLNRAILRMREFIERALPQGDPVKLVQEELNKGPIYTPGATETSGRRDSLPYKRRCCLSGRVPLRRKLGCQGCLIR
jgi:hypothetical protein